MKITSVHHTSQPDHCTQMKIQNQHSTNTIIGRAGERRLGSIALNVPDARRRATRDAAGDDLLLAQADCVAVIADWNEGVSGHKRR